MSELSADAKEKLLELKKDYVVNLPNKTAQLKLSWNNNDLDDLRMQCHKIAGSSASFGFPDISFAAKTMEALCKTRIEHNQQVIATLEEDKTLLNAYRVLQESLDKHSS